MIYYLPDPSAVNYCINNNITVIAAYENFSFTNNNSNIVVGTILLPPPDISMMYISRDNRASNYYTEYLKNDENVKSYIYTLITAMINNKSFGIYFGITNDYNIRIVNDFFKFLHDRFGIVLNNIIGNIKYGDFINENSYANTVVHMYVDNFIDYRTFYNLIPKINGNFDPTYVGQDVFNKYIHDYNMNEKKVKSTNTENSIKDNKPSSEIPSKPSTKKKTVVSNEEVKKETPKKKVEKKATKSRKKKTIKPIIEEDL